MFGGRDAGGILESVFVAEQPDIQGGTIHLAQVNVIGAAIWQTDDPNKITANLKAHYKPTVVKTNAIMRTFGPIADQRLRTDDQDSTVRTATYESMSAFMGENKLLQEAYIFNYQPQASAGT